MSRNELVLKDFSFLEIKAMLDYLCAKNAIAQNPWFKEIVALKTEIERRIQQLSLI